MSSLSGLLPTQILNLKIRNRRKDPNAGTRGSGKTTECQKSDGEETCAGESTLASKIVELHSRQQRGEREAGPSGRGNLRGKLLRSANKLRALPTLRSYLEARGGKRLTARGNHAREPVGTRQEPRARSRLDFYSQVFIPVQFVCSLSQLPYPFIIIYPYPLSSSLSHAASYPTVY